MKRRIFIKYALSITLGYFTYQSKIGFAQANRLTTHPHRLVFNPSVAATMLKSGEWSLWGKLEAHGKYMTAEIPVTIEIATDREFSQIIKTASFSALHEKSYSFTYNYRPTNMNTQLFFRFVVTKNKNETNHSSDSIKKHSRIGEITPW